MHSWYSRECSKFEGTLPRFSAPRFFDLRIVRYSKLSGTGSKSYDGVFNYRVNNELNFRGLKLDSFEEIFERKRNQDIFLLQFNLSFSKISFFLFFFLLLEKVINHYSRLDFMEIYLMEREREKEREKRIDKKRKIIYTYDINIYIVNYKISQRFSEIIIKQ